MIETKPAKEPLTMMSTRGGLPEKGLDHHDKTAGRAASKRDHDDCGTFSVNASSLPPLKPIHITRDQQPDRRAGFAHQYVFRPDQTGRSEGL